MIYARIQIGDGETEDTFAAHKLIYKESDHRTEAPIKKRDVTTYAEQAGENIDPRTVQDAFDYKVQFIIDAQNTNIANVNAIIAAFNAKLYTQKSGSGIRTYKEVTFYNDFKRVKIVGLPEPIAECKELYRTVNGYDCAIVELTIHVSDPTKCNFDEKYYRIPATVDMTIKLYTNAPGTQLYIDTSRPLANGEYLLLLTRGAGRSRPQGPDVRWHEKSKFRWHVPSFTDLEIEPIEVVNGRIALPDKCLWHPRPTASHQTVGIHKANRSRFILPGLKGIAGKCCYGLAVYTPAGRGDRWSRKSNVAYFRSHVEVLNDFVEWNGAGEDPNENAIRTWVSV